MSARGTRGKRLTAVVAGLAVMTLSVSACTGSNADSNDHTATQRGSGNDPAPADSPEPPPQSVATVTSNVDAQSKDVPVDTHVKLKVSDGTFDSVAFETHKGKKLSGSFSADKTTWTADDLLEPGIRYVVSTRATDADGLVAKDRMPFKAESLILDEQTYPSVSPLPGEVVGVGMPVIVTFDIPVTDRAAFERRMTVTSHPAQRGSWHWISGYEVHYRPQHYWKAGTQIDVDINVNSIDAGKGIYGQEDRHVNFKVGDSVVMKQNLDTDRMKVVVNGQLARTLPITGGKPGFETRSGTKLISEKFESKRMDAATVGIDKDDPEYYNIPKVEYAQRVTNSGEFIHAAPWSVDAQGSYNVSHGCVGLSTADAAWLFGITHRGDPVEVTGTNRGIEPGNGWTDWNQSFKEYKAASALH